MQFPVVGECARHCGLGGAGPSRSSAMSVPPPLRPERSSGQSGKAGPISGTAAISRGRKP